MFLNIPQLFEQRIKLIDAVEERSPVLFNRLNSEETHDLANGILVDLRLSGIVRHGLHGICINEHLGSSNRLTSGILYTRSWDNANSK